MGKAPWWERCQMPDGPAEFSPSAPPASLATLRYCPLERGELVGLRECRECCYGSREDAWRCNHPGQTRRPRRRGFWDGEEVEL